jgi:hypothetical protein
VRTLDLIPPPGCQLSPTQLGEQRERARRLASAVRDVALVSDTLRVTFGDDVDARLLEELIATERSCCSFLAVGYDERTRQLSIGAGDAQGREVVSRFHAFFAEAVR